MLPYLCVEVLQEIGGQLPNGDQMNLRAVCKELGSAINPLFYTVFFLRGDRIRGDNGLDIIGRLAAGQLGWCHHAKTVHILPGSKALKGENVAPKWYPSNTELPNLLVTALASMRNIQTIIWTARAADPDWLREAICDSFSTLPFLSDLQVKLEGGAPLLLQPLLRLRRLKIESSDWRPVAMDSVSQVVGRGHRLTSLRLSGAHDYSKVWTMLRVAMLRSNPSTRIYLKELNTPSVTPDLLAYLSSYSGMQRLSLARSQGGARAKNDALANVFFHEVLSQHTKSLVELSCPACAEGRWSFSMDNANVFLELRELEKLHVSLNWEDVVDVEPGMNAVTLLLNTVALLPALRVLIVSSSRVGRHREEWIKTAIENFTSNLESRAVVCASESYYQLAPAISDEGERSTILAYHMLDPESPLVAQIKCYET